VADEDAPERLGPHLSVAGALVMAAALVLAWSGFTSGERTYFAFGALLVAISIALFMRQAWVKYLVFAFAAASIVWWCVVAWYTWGKKGETALLSIISLMPGLIWCAFWLSLCFTVQRGFRRPAKAE
jgi:hypothetical protein